MIIGLTNIRKHDLTTLFKHVYKTEAVTDKSTVLRDRQVLIDDQSILSNQGADAEVTIILLHLLLQLVPEYHLAYILFYIR